MFDHIIPHCPGIDTGAADHKWDMEPFVVEKLLAAGMADAMVGHEENKSIFQHAFTLKPCKHISDHRIGHPH